MIIRRLVVWLFATIFAAALTSVITWKITNTLDVGTKTRVYDYAFVLDKNIQVKTTGKVNCWVNGLGGRGDVYKCTKDDLIFTPCFRGILNNVDKVKCPNTPEYNDAEYFDAIFTSDTSSIMSSYGEDSTPWYITLTTGEKCRFLYGATEVIANKRMDFLCTDSDVTLYLPVTTSDGVSNISCLKSDRLEQCRIKEMWR